MLLFIFSSATYAQTCEVNDVKHALKKVLFLRFRDTSSPLVLDEVKDLLIFYIGISDGVSTVDCSATGSRSNKRISDIVSLGGNATNAIPSCSDGTEYGECSTFKPKYCYAGSLVHRCNYCNCPSASGCTTSGKCETIVNETTMCTDSDNGKNYDVKGTTSWCPSNDAMGIPCTAFIDNCADNILTEGYCDGEQVSTEKYACPNGCKDGACVNATSTTCTDTDGGKNFFVKGTVDYYKDGVLQYTITDNCHNPPYEDVMVVENYCLEDGGTGAQTELCPNDYSCVDGACVNQTATSNP